MAQKVNTFRSNTLKEQQGNVSEGKKNERERKAKSVNEPKFDFNDGRAIKIAGLFLLSLSVFFAISLTSYLFTWQEDQSYVTEVNGGWANLFKTSVELKNAGVSSPNIQNWGGKLGALLAHQFIYRWFGIASFAFVVLLFIIGYRLLFKVTIASIAKSLGYSLFALIFISLTIAFFHAFISDFPHYLEGEFGFWSNRLLQAQIGMAGTAALIAFAGLTFLVIAYNIDFKLPERKKKEMAFADDLPHDTEIEQDINKQTNRQQSTANAPGNNINDRYSRQLLRDQEREKDDQEKENQNSFEVISTLDKEEPFKPEILKPEPVSDLPLFVEKSEEETKANELIEQFGAYDPTLDLSSYKNPILELLEQHGGGKISVDAAELEANKNKIVDTLNNYNIEIDKIKATIGPTVTLYEIIPAPGVRISKIKNLEDDIALSLAALGIRIIAPMPGKGTIGIEVPNQHPEMVSMRSVLATEKFQQNSMDLPIVLGKTISNEVFIADLAKMPHMLVAGATGQGKSVGINSILISLLYKKHPSQLKFVLVDPKKVELTLFKKIERHFLAKLPGEEDAIITDTKKVINTLNSLCIEMDQRYDLLKDAGVRNLKEYNEKFIKRKLNPNNGHKFLPFIVLIIDEFADLMMTAGKEVETPIARLAQLARAIGIHLVIATQRPSVNIITGTIKANFPARLAFRVMSKIDSRTILDAGGAEQLIGRGDMLLSTGSDLIRLQCAFVDTPEVDKITEFIGNQRGYSTAMILPEYVGDDQDGGSLKDFDPADRDALFEDAARLIVLHQQGSTSLIQRKLKLGYNRAGRIIDQLEACGVVGPFEGSKAREVLIPDDYALEQFLNNLNEK